MHPFLSKSAQNYQFDECPKVLTDLIFQVKLWRKEEWAGGHSVNGFEGLSGKMEYVTYSEDTEVPIFPHFFSVL